MRGSGARVAHCLRCSTDLMHQAAVKCSQEPACGNSLVGVRSGEQLDARSARTHEWGPWEGNTPMAIRHSPSKGVVIGRMLAWSVTASEGSSEDGCRSVQRAADAREARGASAIWPVCALSSPARYPALDRYLPRQAILGLAHGARLPQPGFPGRFRLRGAPCAVIGCISALPLNQRFRRQP